MIIEFVPYKNRAHLRKTNNKMVRRVRFADDFQALPLQAIRKSDEVTGGNAPALDRHAEHIAGAVLAQQRAREAVMNARTVQVNVRCLNSAARDCGQHQTSGRLKNTGGVDSRNFEKAQTNTDVHNGTYFVSARWLGYLMSSMSIQFCRND